MNISNTKKYLTSFEIAEITGLTSNYIRKLIRKLNAQGKLKVEKLGNNWLVKMSDLKIIQANRRPYHRKEKIENGCEQ